MNTKFEKNKQLADDERFMEKKCPMTFLRQKM